MEEAEKQELEALRKRVAELEAGQKERQPKPRAGEKFDWQRLLLRKERPLPKRGCSWAFYIVLLLLIVFLALTYKQIQPSDTAHQTQVESVESTQQ